MEVAAEAVAPHAELHLSDGPPEEVVEALFEVLMDDLNPTERRTVEAASILRRVTRPLLTAVLDADGQDVAAAWRTLRELPFTTVTRIGLELDPLARNAFAGDWRSGNPDSWLRSGAGPLGRHCVTRVRGGVGRRPPTC